MKRENYENFYNIVIKGYIDELLKFDSKCKALSLNKKAEKSIYNYYEKNELKLERFIW